MAIFSSFDEADEVLVWSELEDFLTSALICKMPHAQSLGLLVFVQPQVAQHRIVCHPNFLCVPLLSIIFLEVIGGLIQLLLKNEVPFLDCEELRLSNKILSVIKIVKEMMSLVLPHFK